MEKPNWRTAMYATRAKNIRERQFIDVDRRVLAKMPDKDLATWQAKFPSDSPQFILAQFEWQRRLTADQIKTMRWAALIGLAGIILGVLLTKVLEKF
jgi:hypothetical protein